LNYSHFTFIFYFYADPNEHEQVPKRIKVSEMYSRLVLRCQEHVNNEDDESRLPYDVLLRRLQQLQALYDGAQGTKKTIYVQDFVLHIFNALRDFISCDCFF